MPTNLMRTKYALPVGINWIAFASKEAGTIAVYNELGANVANLTLARTGANANAPYKVRYTGGGAGYTFIATVPMGAWFEPNSDVGGADDDETIMYGTDD